MYRHLAATSKAATARLRPHLALLDKFRLRLTFQAPRRARGSDRHDGQPADVLWREATVADHPAPFQAVARSAGSRTRLVTPKTFRVGAATGVHASRVAAGRRPKGAAVLPGPTRRIATANPSASTLPAIASIAPGLRKAGPATLLPAGGGSGLSVAAAPSSGGRFTKRVHVRSTDAVNFVRPHSVAGAFVHGPSHDTPLRRTAWQPAFRPPAIAGSDPRTGPSPTGASGSDRGFAAAEPATKPLGAVSLRLPAYRPHTSVASSAPNPASLTGRDGLVPTGRHVAGSAWSATNPRPATRPRTTASGEPAAPRAASGPVGLRGGSPPIPAEPMPPAAPGADTPTVSDVYPDSAKLGRWLAQALAASAARPPAAGAGFDPRRTPGWAPSFYAKGS